MIEMTEADKLDVFEKSDKLQSIIVNSSYQIKEFIKAILGERVGEGGRFKHQLSISRNLK